MLEVSYQLHVPLSLLGKAKAIFATQEGNRACLGGTCEIKVDLFYSPHCSGIKSSSILSLPGSSCTQIQGGMHEDVKHTSSEQHLEPAWHFLRMLFPDKRASGHPIFPSQRFRAADSSQQTLCTGF